MKRINFLLWACFFKWIFFEQGKFEGSKNHCEGELLKQQAGISFIADNHHFSQNQQQRSWHCQCCAAPHSFHQLTTEVTRQSGLFLANPSQLLKRGVHHGPATPKISVTDLPHHHFFTHDILQCRRAQITSETYLPWTKSISKIITKVSKARAHQAARTISCNLGHSYSNTSTLVQQNNFPKSCTCHQKCRKKKKIRLIFVMNSASEFRTQKPHQEQPHAEFYFIQKQPQHRLWSNAELQPKRETSVSSLCSAFCPSRYNHTQNFQNFSPDKVKVLMICTAVQRSAEPAASSAPSHARKTRVTLHRRDFGQAT